MSLDSEVELMRRLPFFAKMEPSTLKLLCFSSERLTFHAGQVMFYAGDVADAVYVMIEGHVAITAPASGGPVLVGTLGPMDIVGEIAIFADLTRTATVTATTPVDALRIAKEQLISIIRGNPDAALELLRQLATRLAKTTVRLTDSLAGSAPAARDASASAAPNGGNGQIR